ncbi:Glycosyltransferase involved in cell wall bisynthesis [Arthrobacter alpinus]|uniref:Glycosyltransferase involved in cell wall bisynthesis n=2 Tax=Arthrobacter alpinus TaxID=656366 RepID=A0A1H5KJE6_9MICC|nr:Glycosyltransferase involved in cell wall bisynthesis [Arthrobacter alpinus]
MTRHNPIYVSRFRIKDPVMDVKSFSLQSYQSKIQDRIFSSTGHSTAFTGLLRDVGARLIHAHFGPDGMLALPAAKAISVPLVVTLHGRDVTVKPSQLLKTGKPVAARYALTRKRIMRQASKVLCVSNDLKRKALDQGFDEENIVTHYIGIDTQKFAFSNSVREARFIHVARLVEKKGTSNLLHAFAKISSRNPDSVLDIVGDGPLRASLEEQARNLGISRQTIFHGPLSNVEVRGMLKRSAAFVLPSVTAGNGDREGLPISILEAMSSGTPVISTFHSGIPEAIPTDSQGLLVDEHDVLGLSERMHAVLNDAGFAQQLGTNGAEFVRKNFDLVKQTEELERIYDELF